MGSGGKHGSGESDQGGTSSTLAAATPQDTVVNNTTQAPPDLVYDSDDEEPIDLDGPQFSYDGDGDVVGVTPQMPCTGKLPDGHRDKQPGLSLYNACVARPVKPAELKVNQEAWDAM